MYQGVSRSLSQNTVVPIDVTVAPGHITTNRTPVLSKCSGNWNIHRHTSVMCC